MLGKDLIMQTLLGGGSSGGGGSAAVSPKEVNFYDYDGTCVYAYTVAEAQKLSALPAGPEHPGLVFQGWNWSLEGVKGLTRAMNIGAMYTTDDGTTRLYITLQEGRTSPMLGVGVNGTVTVDWGDGTEPDVLTGTNVKTTVWTPNHAYAKAGDYVIRLTVDGEMAFNGSTSGSNLHACILRYASGGDTRNRVYQNSLKRLEIGNDVTSIRSSAFYNCYSLESVTVTKGVMVIGDNTFYNCYSLASVTIPDGVTDLVNYALDTCHSLTTVMLPESMTSIGNSTFSNCSHLTSVTLPESVTSIGTNAFYECHSLTSVTIPEKVATVSTSAFGNCYGMAYCDFTACTAVPTLKSTSAFTNIPADCEIRVPAALYDEWIAATNWATYANYIKAY